MAGVVFVFLEFGVKCSTTGISDCRDYGVSECDSLGWVQIVFECFWGRGDSGIRVCRFCRWLESKVHRGLGILALGLIFRVMFVTRTEWYCG